MKKGKKIYIGLIVFITLVVTTLSFSYAFFTNQKEEHGKLNIVAGTLDYKITGDHIENNKVAVVGNTTTELKLIITSLNEIDSKYELYYNSNDGVEVGYVLPEENTKGEIGKQKEKEVTIYIRNNTSTSQEVTLGVEGGFLKNELILTKGKRITEFKFYKELLLNGTDPVLASNLVPVIINDNGTVRKADITNKWYSYEEKEWANAVILKDGAKVEEDGSIKEESIESYFVWIPKYSYQLWDLGNYNSLTSIDSSKQHAIPINFGTTNTSDSVNGECTIPGVAGESGNCKVGDYMTHPAFLAFDSNGLWVGKFETGYDGATSTSAAQVNSSTSADIDRLIIKPNVYSWRSITVGNAFKVSYQYKRELESHMMKNTEWGAVAYLTNSNYGRCTDNVCSEVRINNNSAYITGYAATEQPTLGVPGISVAGNRIEGTVLGKDGNYTVRYLNNKSNVGSTTGNYNGIYDMSGGSWEYVAGYTTKASTVDGLSGITTIYSDFFMNSKWNKYYDKYYSTKYTDYNNRILGDATGEMGPFQLIIESNGLSYARSSWHKDQGGFLKTDAAWFVRGSFNGYGTYAGIFSTNAMTSIAYREDISFRVVLAP